MADIFSQDTREKLEAEMLDDIEHFVNGEWVVTHETIADWLDRQAAITEREREQHWLEIVGASANCNLELTNQIAELQAQLDEAKAKPDCDCCEWQEENAKLRSQVEMLVSDGLLAAYLRHCERIDELQEQLDKLSSDELHWRSEADFWKRKYELIAKAVNDVARNYVDVEDEGLA